MRVFYLALLLVSLFFFLNAPSLQAQEISASAVSQAARPGAVNSKNFRYGLALLSDFDSLPRFSDFRAAQDSGSAEKFLRKEGDWTVISDVRGPGCLTRLRIANPGGQIRFRFDDETKPKFEAALADLTGGELKPFAPPLTGMDGETWISYFPLPFVKRLRIEVQNAGKMQVQAQYALYPDAAPVRAFTKPLSGADADRLDAIIRLWERPGKPPRPFVVSTRNLGFSGGGALQPGETHSLGTVSGPALLTRIRIRVTPASRFTLRQTVLRVFWDEAKTPAIEAPVGDFFGASFTAAPFASLPEAIDADGLTCYWPMPFHKKARLELVNRGTVALQKVEWNVEAQNLSLAAEQGYFHAAWRHEKAAAGKPFPLLEANGRGQWVGMQLALQGESGEKWRDAMQAITVDGAESSAWRGSIAETYSVNYASADIPNPVLQVCTLSREDRGRFVTHRYAFADAAPFQKSLRVTLADAKETLDCAAVGYCYADSPEAFGPPLDSATLTMPGYKLPDVLEAEDLTHEGGEVRDDTNLAGEASGGKALTISDKGAALTIEVKEEKDYNVGIGQILQNDSALRIGFALDDEPADELNDIRLNNLDALGVGGQWTYFMALHLKPGKHVLHLTPEKGKTAYVDYLRLEAAPK